MEIGNFPEKEFRIMIVKMIKDLRKRMEARIERMQEMFNKDLQELKNKQTEMNNTITEMKNTLEGINSRINEIQWINDLEDKMVEITAAEQNKEKRKKRSEDSLRDLWNNIKCANICITGVPEGEDTEKGSKNIFEEIIMEKFLNVGKEIVSRVQEAQRVPGRMNTRRNTQRHIVTKLTKIKGKENLLKATREK